MNIHTLKYMVLLLLLLQLSCNTKTHGCVDPQASNYDETASYDDNSCIYDPVLLNPVWVKILSEQINETSGLMFWDGSLWTINDDSDTRLYGLDTASATIDREIFLTGVANRDWEGLAQDEDFIYVGDMGNNMGDRGDLHILRIEKQSLKSGDPSIDTIWFSYDDQKLLVSPGAYQTAFDCEAFIASPDSLYLFTKNWISSQTTCYVLPKLPGRHVAHNRESFDTMGLVTGATYLHEENILALCGYASLSQPFLYIFHDFPESSFFSGRSRRFNIVLPFHQVEGVASPDGLRYYLSSEASTLPMGNELPPKLFLLDLTELLAEWLK